MPFVETDLWVMEIPDEWHAELQDDCVSIVDCDELGVLDVSAIKKQGGLVAREDLKGFAQALLDKSYLPQNLSIVGYETLYFVYTEEEMAWREWYIAADDVFLYITYNTDEENVGIDDVVVDQILSTLVINR